MISQLLLYDRVVIPTHDFAAVAACALWLGEGVYDEAISTGSLAFVRPNGLLGYGGAGNGLSEFTIRETPQCKFDWCAKTLFREPEAALVLQLEMLTPKLRGARRTAILEMTQPAIFVANHPPPAFMDRVVGYTRASVESNARIRAELLSRLGTRPEKLLLQALPGIDDSTIRFGSPSVHRDAIDLAMQVAEIHRDVLLAEMFPRADVYIPASGEEVFSLDSGQHHGRPGIHEGFPRLLDLNKVPDVESALMSSMVSVEDLWKLRNTADARAFRRWLAVTNPEDARELEQAYVSLLSQAIPPAATLPMRLLRFVIGLGIGAAYERVGAVAALVDAVAGDKVLGDTSPKLFIDRYRQLLSSRNPS